MEFKQNEFEALRNFVKDVQDSVESVASTLSDIKASDRSLKVKLSAVEIKCDKEIKDLNKKIETFQGNLDELSTRLREVSQNQIDIQCQLIKLNLNPNMTKFLRRAVSFDTADNVPVLLCNSKHDSGVNINTDHEEHVNFEKESVVENSPSNNFLDSQLLQRQRQYSVTPANRKNFQNFRNDDQFSSFSEESEKFNLASELLQHERSFCNNMSMIQSHYYEPLKGTQLIPAEDMKFIFCDVLFRFYEKHCILLHKLQELLSDWADPPYPIIIELYSKSFTVHGTAARNYIFYSTAFNKIMTLVQTYFVNDSAVCNFLQNANGKISKKKLDLVQFEFCLRAPLKTVEFYIDIFERYISTRDLESFKLLKIQKLINNFKKINEDINRSLQFTLSSSSSDNIYRLIKPYPKNKKKQATNIQKKFNSEQYYGSLDTRKSQYKSSNSLSRETIQVELSALDIKMRQFQEANNKSKIFKSVRSNTTSEPSLYSEQIVSYDTTGDTTTADVANRSPCSTINDSKKKPQTDKNINAFRNTVAAFFSKCKNNHRFNGEDGSESLFGTWRKSKPRENDSNRRGSWNHMSPDCPTGSLRANRSASSTSSTANQLNLDDDTLVRENCVVLAYSNKSSEKIKYFAESDDSTSTGVEI